MRNGGSGGGLIVGIIAVIGIVLFILSRGSVPGFFHTIGTIILVIVIIAVVALVLLIVFAAKTAKKIPAGKRSSSKNRLNEEQAAIVNDGRQELMAIRRKLVTIKNSTIRSKGNKVCASMDRVFKILKEKPEKIPQTRQFLNYYLPTVSKVIQKYQRLEANGVPTADMTEKIKKFLDDVDAAMDKQCTHLYDDDKLDMTVDMEAMTIAIQRDGLLDANDFKIPGSGGISSVAEDFRQQAENMMQSASQNLQNSVQQALQTAEAQTSQVSELQTTPPQPQTTPPQPQTTPPQPQTTPPQPQAQTIPPRES